MVECIVNLDFDVRDSLVSELGRGIMICVCWMTKEGFEICRVKEMEKEGLLRV
jgi:hypothetical protein